MTLGVDKQPTILVDSHCHLDMLAEKEDLALVIKRANDNGVKYMQTICTRLDNFANIIKIAEVYPNIFASVGVHPNEVKGQEFSYEQLSALADHQRIIGVGETGLDYYYETSEKLEQISSFHQHIKLSQEKNLPIIVHTRDAEEDTASILGSRIRENSFTGLIHCFTASKDFAKKMLDFGFYISVAGIVTFKNAELLKDVVRFVPLDKLLIETDSPYLAPVPMRGKQNEPAFVEYVAQCIAELKNLTIAEVASQTTNNFFTLFSKATK